VEAVVAPRAIARLLRELDPDSVEEFATGLSLPLQRLLDGHWHHDREALADGLEGLIAYLNSWRLSLAVASHSDVQDQIREARARWNQGRTGSMSVEELVAGTRSEQLNRRPELLPAVEL
jgi:hypothetical protein